MAEGCQRRRGRVLDPPLLTRIGEEMNGGTLPAATRAGLDLPLLTRISDEVLGGFAAPGYAEGGFEDVGGNFCEGDAGGAFFAPAAWDRGEDFWGVLNHSGLLIGGE